MDYPLPDRDPAMRPRTVKEFAPDEQPREKALRHGCGALSAAELWALVLRTGLPGKPITELCRDLMLANAGSLHSLERRSRAEILSMKGIGTTKAIQIEAVLELIRRYNAEEAPEHPLIRSSRDIDAAIRPVIANLPHEEMWALMLNRANRLVASMRVSSGSATATVFDVKKVLKQALLENAESVVLCHNHPSGTLRPSSGDDQVTASCRQACKAMDMRLLDHLIVTLDGYYSYADESRL